MAGVTRARLGVNFLCVGGAADGGGRGILRRECGLTLSTISVERPRITYKFVHSERQSEPTYLNNPFP